METPTNDSDACTPSRAGDAVSDVLNAWAGASTFADSVAHCFGPTALPQVELEREEQPAEERLRELFESLALRGGAFGRYRVKGEVGRGGMGVVLRAWDSELKRHLAMKLALTRRDDFDTSRVARFLEEAQVTAQLDHPGIVPVHELGLDSAGRVYFTMRLVKGRSLGAVFDLAKAGSDGWTQARVLGVLIKACEAVGYAHARGVIHRDLKPANVMVGAFGEVYVMDWGLARVLARPEATVEQPSAGTDASSSAIVADVRRTSTPDSPLATAAGHALGTPAYMAPEQARGELDALGPRSDVYAMGAILYEFLAGCAPYADQVQRAAPHAVLARVVAGPPTALRRLAGGAPSELIAICDKAMAREAGERYGDLLELIEDLRAFQEHRPGRAWSDSPLRWATKLVRRRPAGAIGAIAVVLAAATAVALYRANEVEAARRVLSDAGRERHVVEEVQRLAKYESPLSPEIRDAKWQETHRADHVRINASAAREALKSLASFGIDVAAASSGAEIAERIAQAGSARLRDGLVEELYLLAKYIGISGIAEASYHHARRDAPASEQEQWDEMVRQHDDLVRVWPLLAPALRATNGDSAGVRALERFSAWLVDRSPGYDVEAISLDAVRGSELDFVSYVVQSIADRDAAARFFARARDQHPENVWCHIRVARAASIADRAEEALPDATAAVALWPEAEITNELFGLAVESTDPPRAIAAYQRGLVTHPDSVGLLTSLGITLQGAKRFDEAQAAFEHAIRQAQDDVDLLYNLGMLFDDRGASDPTFAERAVEQFRRVTQLRPQWWEGFYRLGRSLQLLERLPESIEAFDAGLALHPKGRDLRVSKAESLAQLGQHAQAVDLCLALLSDFPDDVNGLSLFDLLMQGEPDEERRATYQQRLHAIQTR